MSQDFQGKRIIVTGAGKGIGRACVQELSRRGATAIAIARTQSDLDSLSAETGCETISADLMVNAAARAAMEQAGLCDGLKQHHIHA